MITGGAGLGGLLAVPVSAAIIFYSNDQKWLVVLANVISSGLIAFICDRLQRRSPDLRKGILTFCFSFFYPFFLTSFIGSYDFITWIIRLFGQTTHS
jgi:nitrate reductase NapE component